MERTGLQFNPRIPLNSLPVHTYAVLTGWKDKVPWSRGRQAKAFKFEPDTEIQKGAFRGF